MTEPDFIAKLFIIALVIYGTSLHEMGHAFVATWLGDPTPMQNGRLTFNPIPHLYPPMTAIVFPALFYMLSGAAFGLAMTPIDPSRFRKPLRDNALVALAGPAMNFLFAGAMIGILWIPDVFQWRWEYGDWGPANYSTMVLFHGALWNLILGVFNLLPIPPLDGASVIRIALPLQMRRAMDNFAQMGMMTIVIAIIVGNYLFQQVSGPLFLFFFKLLPISSTYTTSG